MPVLRSSDDIDSCVIFVPFSSVSYCIVGFLPYSFICQMDVLSWNLLSVLALAKLGNRMG